MQQKATKNTEYKNITLQNVQEKCITEKMKNKVWITTVQQSVQNTSIIEHNEEKQKQIIFIQFESMPKKIQLMTQLKMKMRIIR